MLKTLSLENFTLFEESHLEFGKNLNVFIGENGSGKSHILKAAYTPIALSAERHPDGGGDFYFSNGVLKSLLAAKLQAVFRPDVLWRLVRRKRGRHNCRLSY